MKPMAAEYIFGLQLSWAEPCRHRHNQLDSLDVVLHVRWSYQRGRQFHNISYAGSSLVGHWLEMTFTRTSGLCFDNNSHAPSSVSSLA